MLAYGRVVRGVAAAWAKMASPVVGMAMAVIGITEASDWVAVRTKPRLAASETFSGMMFFDMGFILSPRRANSDYVRLGGVWVKNAVSSTVIPWTIGTSGPNQPLTATLMPGKVVVLSGSLGNGNGLTLSGSYQTVATVPVGFRPAYSLQAPGSAASTTGLATVQVNPDGSLRAASAGAVAFFEVTYLAA